MVFVSNSEVHPMVLINRHLPEYQFAEAHSLYIRALPGRVLDVVTRPEVVDDPVVRGLISLRELPNRLAGSLGFASALRDRASFGLADFTFLGRDGDREIALGLAGRFWQSDYGLITVADEQDFLALKSGKIAKLVMNFTADVEGQGTRLTTRTRIWCSDNETKRSFLPYWWLIRPASGLIRRRLLRRARDAALRQ
jgi:hypothetical protein